MTADKVYFNIGTGTYLPTSPCIFVIMCDYLPICPSVFPSIRLNVVPSVYLYIFRDLGRYLFSKCDPPTKVNFVLLLLFLLQNAFDFSISLFRLSFRRPLLLSAKLDSSIPSFVSLYLCECLCLPRISLLDILSVYCLNIHFHFFRPHLLYLRRPTLKRVKRCLNVLERKRERDKENLCT